MEQTDANLSSGISAFDFSNIQEVDATVPKSYDAFLKDSDIFDDRDVLAAYDDQLDAWSEELATTMSTSFESWLTSVDTVIENTNTALNNTRDAFSSLKNEFPKQIWKKDKSEAKKDAHYIGGIKSMISISGTVTSLRSDLKSIDVKLTTAATTINTVYTALGGFKEPFRKGMENAFYGESGLEGVVNSQKAVATILSAIRSRFTELKSHVTHNKGAAINALTTKIDDAVVLSGYVVQLLEDSFGN
ncbi:hypothetical protein HK253_07765 [Streptococcus agalactiae]|nr:hypothetical protein [Streptococcus agalactiae]